MGRFILVDQSVKSPGGHHFEYAARILDAAKAQGDDTMLLAHRSLDACRWQIGHTAKAAFSLTFWDNYRHYYVRHTLQARRIGLRAYLRSALSDSLALRFQFSRVGLVFARAAQTRLRDIILQPFLDHDLSGLRTARWSLLLARFMLMGRDCAKLAGERLARPLSLFGKLARVIALLLFALPGTLLVAIRLLRRTRDPARCFAGEIARSLRRLKLTAEDVIFVPNATAAELGALALLRNEGSPLARAHWAFLFRRPVFHGYPESYAHQSEGVRLHRVQFAALQRVARSCSMSFYTDTDELTEQYNRLGVFKFKTLPVPVNRPASPTPHKPPGAPLLVGYLGDARDEKGFQSLPSLVEAIAADKTADRPVRFLFQANFNVPGGEPESRFAKHRLSSWPPDIVELAEGPFDREKYGEFLRRMDVMVVPYSAEQYAARSSGVLAEALAAGIPAVVPAGSWMSAVAEPSRFRHVEALFKNSRSGLTRLGGIQSTFDRIEDKILRIDSAGNYLLVRMRFEEPVNSFIRYIISFNGEYGEPIGLGSACFKVIGDTFLAAIPVPNVPQISIFAAPLEATVVQRPLDVELDLYRSETALPLHAGIVVFDRIAEDFVTAVREAVAFYDHHKRAAEHLRAELEPLYSPAVLVERLSRKPASHINNARVAEVTMPVVERGTR